jgi:hypothetical protein
MSTATKFPKALRAIKKLNPLTAFLWPKTAVKNRVAVLTLPALRSACGTIPIMSARVVGSTQNTLTGSEVGDIGQEVENGHNYQGGKSVASNLLDWILGHVSSELEPKMVCG